MWIIDALLLVAGLAIAAVAGLLWWHAFHPEVWQAVLLIGLPVVFGAFWLWTRGTFSPTTEDWADDAAERAIENAKRK